MLGGSFLRWEVRYPLAACVLSRWYRRVVRQGLRCRNFVSFQAVTSRRNKDMSPAMAKRKRQTMARATESLLFLLNFANTSAALLVPCVIITKTAAEPLPAASLTFLVSPRLHMSGMAIFGL